MPVGFVALLDVLGFSTLMTGGEEDTRLKDYLGVVQTALGDTVGSTLDYVVFSDSIVLTTKRDSDEAMQILLAKCSNLFGLLLQHDIAIRGAIAYGSFFREESAGGVFVAGRPVVEAYDFEMKQDWVGVMLAPSTVRRLPDLSQRVALPGSLGSQEAEQLIQQNLHWAAFLRPFSRIPFHSNNPFETNECDGFVVPPTSGIPDPVALTESLAGSLKALVWLKSLAPNPAAQAKYQHAYNWLFQLHLTWRDIAYWQKRLQEERGSV